MVRTSMTRAYALGLGYGNIWLVMICLVFGILDMLVINTTVQGTVFSILGLLLIGCALLYLCIRFLRSGYTLPRSVSGKLSRTSARIFGGLILLEIIGWAVLDIVLGMHNLFAWMVPVNLFIIGAHFIPLAFVFKVPAYLVMGLLWIVAIVGSMLILPSTTILGHVSVWTTIPSLCCIIITWLTVLFLMTTEMKALRAATQTPELQHNLAPINSATVKEN